MSLAGHSSVSLARPLSKPATPSRHVMTRSLISSVHIGSSGIFSIGSAIISFLDTTSGLSDGTTKRGHVYSSDASAYCGIEPAVQQPQLRRVWWYERAAEDGVEGVGREGRPAPCRPNAGTLRAPGRKNGRQGG